MKKWIVFLTLMLLVSSFARGAWAYRAYVSDTLEITMRTGPSTSHKILAMLTSGQAVEVVETSGGWSRIRVLEGNGKGKDGWVLSRFLIKRSPWKAQYEAMRAENEALKEKHGDIEQHWQELTQHEKELTQQLDQATQSLEILRKQYEELKQGSANYLQLKSEYEKAKSALDVARKTLQKLTNENESLRYSQNIKWFATGALVPLFGWLVGLFMGRRQRRNRPTLYR